MANPNLFRSTGRNSKTASSTNGVKNRAGGKAYDKGAELSLATYAVTGTFNDTFYTKAQDQLSETLGFCDACSPAFIGRLAVYAREQGFMKDMPALLSAHLTTRGEEGRVVLSQIFSRVIDNGRMLRNFVQIMRSGTVGRKSLGSFPKKLVQNWFAEKTPDYIFRQAVGKNPSLADVIKMVHPRAEHPERNALLGYLIGKEVNHDALPPLVTQFEEWKKSNSLDMPKVDFRMLTANKLSSDHWKQIARTAPWHMTRMNLNTFSRHGVLEDKELCSLIAGRLSNQDIIRKVKVFPYQIMAAYKASFGEMPAEITDALHDALEVSVENVPEIPGNVWVFPDVSGSMQCSATAGKGWGFAEATDVRYVDIAALFSAAVKRKNPSAKIIPVDTKVHTAARIDSRDTVMTNAGKLAEFGGGGTNLSAAMKFLNEAKKPVDLVIYVSDNESWADRQYGYGTSVMDEFKKLRREQPNAKMVCIDIDPGNTTQARDEEGIVLNIGGFSDRVFDVISTWMTEDKSQWVDQIKRIEI